MKHVMKRFVLLFIAIGVLVTLAACGSAQPGGPDGEAPPSQSDEDEAPSGSPGALSFDFSNAVGVQLEGAGVSSAASADSNFYKVLPDGSLELALVTGKAHVEEFFVRNGKIYVVFDPHYYWDEESLDCVLAEVDQLGDVVCVDSSIDWVELDSIQFDAHGGIYYRARTHDGEDAIRRSVDGVATDFYKATDAIYITEFIATRDGMVLLEGSSSGSVNERPWIRVVEEGGRITEFPAGSILGYLPDGSLLMEDGTRFLFHDGVQVDSRPYRNRFDDSGFDSWFSRYDQLYRDADGMVALTSAGLLRVYPELEAIPVGLEEVTNGAMGLGLAAVAGFDASSAPRAFLVDLDSGEPVDVLGSRRIEVLRLMLRLSEERLLIYGLDLDRNQPVFAEYDLRFRELNVADVEHKLADSFETLDWSANHVPPEPSVRYVPEPEFTATTLDGWDTGMVAFDASEVMPGTWLNEAHWDFGDGSEEVVLTATISAEDWLQPIHEYAEPGPHTVTLTLVDQHGERHTVSQSVPEVSRVPASEIAAGAAHSLVLRDDGTVWAWGDNGYGQLGDGTSDEHRVPTHISGLSDVTDIAAGEYHSLAVKNDGTVWAWGDNSSGQLGDGTYDERRTPVQVDGLSGITNIAAGGEHSLAVKRDGTVWAWGYNGSGRLGDGTHVYRPTPVQVSGITDVTGIAAGGHHSLAVKNDGTVWAWGENGNGQLGDGTRDSHRVPLQVTGVSGVISIAAGSQHSLAAKDDGTVWAWGANWNGQLGDGTRDERRTPIQVDGLTGITGVVAGEDHSLVVKDDGTVWAWGRNMFGALGDDTNDERRTPVQVNGLTDVSLTVAGGHHSLAVKGDGTVWVWGDGRNGRLGNGLDDGSEFSPVRVAYTSRFAPGL